MSILKTTGKTVLRLLVPWALVRQTRSVATSFRNVRGAAKAAAAARRRAEDRNMEEAAPVARDQRALSGRERFRTKFEQGGWDEDSLAVQYGYIRVTRFVFLFFAAAVIPGAVYFALLSPPWWMVVVGVPALMGFMVMCLGRALQHAWWGTQIVDKDFMSFKDFMSRNDVWARLFGP